MGAPTPESGTEFQFLVDDEMIDLVQSVRAAGIRTGMLTNNVREIREHWWAPADWTVLFDDIVDGHEVGIRKPGPQIYGLAVGRLGVTRRRAASSTTSHRT